MKCPKCQYISFDSGDRCRNCGYDFSLVQDLPANDLSIHNELEPVGPFADIPLHQKAPDTGSMPLFRRENGDPDAPLVTPSAAPRAPLSVRRGAPTPPPRPRRRAESDPEPRLALDTAEFAVAPETQAPRATVVPEPPTVVEEAPHQAAASAVARITGGLVDFAILGGIDLAVVYFTLKICDMTFPQLTSLPIAPLVAFLALLNGGYLVTFVAAGGQTIGKMAAGTRVVPADPAAPAAERVSFGQAVVRAAGYVVSILPAGLGFLPALAGRERRAVHDRLSDTRVVRA
jgi:uncharacterized RDD family membrane protein YckC